MLILRGYISSLFLVRDMKFFIITLCFLSFCDFSYANEWPYKKVDSFSDFISSSKLGDDIPDNERLLIDDSYIDVSVTLKGKPQPGSFYLIHSLMSGMGLAPIKISHSVFIAAENGTVLNAYVTPDAATILSDVDADAVINIKAIHLYNFSRGPRLIILAAAPVTKH